MPIASALVSDRGGKEPFRTDEARGLIMGLILVHSGMAHSRDEHVRSAAARLLNKVEKELLSGVISTTQQNTRYEQV